MVEPRENRVHMMLSGKEMDAIDDWRFANRVATRSDAIRRLCSKGLDSDQRSRMTLEFVLDILESLARSLDENNLDAAKRVAELSMFVVLRRETAFEEIAKQFPSQKDDGIDGVKDTLDRLLKWHKSLERKALQKLE